MYNDCKEQLDKIKENLKNLFDILEAEGVIEETSQKYQKIKIQAIFDYDLKELYTTLDRLKTLSK